MSKIILKFHNKKEIFFIFINFFLNNHDWGNLLY